MALTRIDSYLVDLDSLGGITFDDQAGTPTFKVDAVNHRVGIGTTNPLTKLDINGDLSFRDNSNILLSLVPSSSRVSLHTQTFEASPVFRRWLTYPFRPYDHVTGALSSKESALVTELNWITSNYPGGTSSTVGAWEDNTSYWDSIASAYGFNTDTDIILHNRLFVGGKHPRASEDKECGLWISPGGINGGTNTATNASITYGPVIDTDFGGGGTTGALSAKIRLSGYVRGAGSNNLEFASINFDSQIHPYNGNFAKGKAKIWAKNVHNHSLQQYGSALVFGTSARGPSSAQQTYADRIEITENGDLNFLPSRSASIINTTNNDLIFGTNNSEKVRILSTGNVGIGTTNPETKLHVRGRGNFGGSDFNSNVSLAISALGEAYVSSGAVSNRGLYYNAGTICSLTSNTGTVNSGCLIDFNAYNSSSGATGIYIGAAAGSGINTAANFVVGRRTGAQSWAESLRVDTSGNVGIGTTNPGQKLHILGSGQQIIKLQDSGNTYGLDIGNNTTESFISTVDAKPITFYTSNLERIRIDANGRILTDGITAGRGAAFTQHIFNIPSNKYYFEIRSTSNDPGYGDILFSDGAGGSYGIVGYDHNTDSLRFYANAEERLRITSSGNVGIGTTNPVSKLDVRGNIYASRAYLVNSSEGFDTAPLVIPGVQNQTSAIVIGQPNVFNWRVGNQGTTGTFYIGSASTDQKLSIKTDGNVGIGTTNPRTVLEINGDHNSAENTVTPVLRLSTGNSYAGNNTGSALEFGTTNTTYPTWVKGRIGCVYSGSSSYGGHLVFQTNTGSGATAISEKMRITDAGNVGIGTTNPSQKLHVHGSGVRLSGLGTNYTQGGSASAIYVADSNKYFDFSGGIVFRGTGSTWASRFTATSNLSASGQVLGIFKSESTAGQVTGSPYANTIAMFLNDGNVGIGTSNPDRRLSINGQTRIGGGLDYGLTDVLSVAPGTINFDAPGLAGGRLKITSTGNVGINTTNPASKLHIIGSISSGTETEPQLVVRDANGAMRAFEFYFSLNKPTAIGTSVNVTLVSVSSLGNFHQAAFTVEYGTRLQGVSDATTSVCMKQYGVNRFVGNNVAVTDTNDIASDTNSNNHANVTCVATASDSYVIRIEFSSSVASSTFCSGVIRGWGVDASWGSNISFFKGSGN